ncbi:hypothetical protein EAI30_07620 [Romboutsia ilealis]|uniref:Uncharacterized protein n=1 Tax=Romboutsia faecis TaxID=2764597 RepID=A0ABR7JKQ1_9FIRM|nr:hypothetical protein [Romboutsia faecis]MBC5995273.1 hypothetical protein [Romboutsia faecis]MRN24481.1 hypothetical protein [Romboutsia ilealis]
MPAPRLIIPKEILQDLIDKRYNQREMSKELKISKETLSKLLRENNLKIKPKIDNNIGKRFGKLVVLERVDNSKDSRKVYRCQCDCGNITDIKGKYLYNGDTRSCVCHKKDFKEYKEKNYKEALKKIGEKHGMLTIIDVNMNNKRRAYDMVCKCECGTISRKTYSQIIKGEIVSCGCYAREMSSKRLSESILSIIKNNHNKNWYFKKHENIVFCRSGYEVIYANYLIANNIEFEYEPEHFKLENGRRYTPDFYLLKEDRYIEIKGVPYEVLDRGNQKYRVELFRKNHKLQLLYWDDIYEICHLPYKSYGTYAYKAKSMSISVEDYLGKFLYLVY